MRGHIAFAVFVVALSCAVIAAQTPTDLSVDDVLDRMGAYLDDYEAKLIAVTADEEYEQREIVIGSQSFSRQRTTVPEIRTLRRLVSDVAFVRLPGSEEWAGFRDVRRVDGKVVKEGGIRLSELLAANSDVLAQAMAITRASSKYNLGAPRTINMPTVPLEVIRPRYRQRFSYRLGNAETVRGAKTVRVIYKEVQSPTLIKRSDGNGDVESSGVIWVEPQSGKVWRAAVVFRDPGAAPKNTDAGLRVEFAMNRRLETMVPIEMYEIFYVPSGRGQGKASYKNFRRFETGARVVPE